MRNQTVLPESKMMTGQSTDRANFYCRPLGKNPEFYRTKRTAQLYLLIVSIVGLGIFFILNEGGKLPPPASRISTESVAPTATHSTGVSKPSFFASVESTLQQNVSSPLSRL